MNHIDLRNTQSHDEITSDSEMATNPNYKAIYSNFSVKNSRAIEASSVHSHRWSQNIQESLQSSADVSSGDRSSPGSTHNSHILLQLGTVSLQHKVML